MAVAGGHSLVCRRSPCPLILRVALCLCGLVAGVQHAGKAGSQGSRVQRLRRRLVATDDNTVAVYTAAAYAYFYGAPAATSVPLVVGFRTGALAAYNASQSSKVRISAASGVDFSIVDVSKVLDVVALPTLTSVTATATDVQLFMDPGALQPLTDYELTLLVNTTTAGTTLGNVTISWYTFTVATSTWVKRETSTQNTASQGNAALDGPLAGGSLKTSSNSLGATSLVSAWRAAGPQVLVVLLDLYMTSLANGVVSVMPSPPSAWDFRVLNSSVYDGAPCASGSIGGVEGQTVGARFSSKVSACFLRRRGARVNSFDFNLAGTDISQGLLITMFVPLPPAGSFQPWYISYREWGSAPGYLVSPLVASTAVKQQLGPRPLGQLMSASSTYPLRASTLQVSFNAGATLAYQTNSHIDISLDASVFSINAGGCRMAGMQPFGVVVRTDTNANMCVITWTPVTVAGTGTIQVTSTGQVTGTGVDFDSLGVIALDDGQTIDGSAFHYLLAAGTRYIVQSRGPSGAAGTTVQVLASSTSNLVGTGTLFSTGNFTQMLVVGDTIKTGSRSFVVTNIRSDTVCDVTENGAAPATSLAAATYKVVWKTRMQVVGYEEETSNLVPVPAGTSFSLELAKLGVAFWSRTYTLAIDGLNGATTGAGILATRPEIRIYSGRADQTVGEQDFWSAPFAGDTYNVFYPEALGSASLYPTTVAAAAKAPVVLTFTTGTSTRYKGGVDENMTRGIVLRLSTNYTSALQFYLVGGAGLGSTRLEAAAVDCSTLLLEVWTDAPTGTPVPQACWWTTSAQAPTSIYVRFQAGGGLRMRTSYELVFLATLAKTANDVSDLVTLEVMDGDGVTYLNIGQAGIAKTVVDQSINNYADQPIIRTVDLVSPELIQTGSLLVRLRSPMGTTNRISANNVVRLFLYPLTAWSVGSSCTATRTDGGIVTCAVERTGRCCDNTIVMTLDQNSPSIGNDSSTIFTISGLRVPPGGFLSETVGAEVWNHPRETPNYYAWYVESPVSAGSNFSSVPVSGGYGFLSNFDKPFVGDENNTVSILYQPAATCRSTAGVPCRLNITAPVGFRALGAEPPPNGAPSGTVAAPAVAPARCTYNSCVLEMAAGSVLWSGNFYAFQMRVTNAYTPLAQDDVTNVWRIYLSGQNRWSSGREDGLTAVLDRNSSFAVLGRLTSVAVQPDSLVCGAPTGLRIQFVNAQRVPVGGTINVTAPAGFSLQIRNSSQCFTRGLVNWPANVNCSVTGQVAVLTLGTALEAGSFQAFELQGVQPTAGMPAALGGRFALATASPTSGLDATMGASWSGQLDDDGSLLFPDLMGCWPQGFFRLDVVVDNMLPYDLTSQASTAVVRFEWTDLDIPVSGLAIRIYAPAGFRWQAAEASGFNASGGNPDATTAPFMLDPRKEQNYTYPDANVLYLLSTGPLQRHVLYGFAAQIRVPSAAPGTPMNAASGALWYATFGEGPRWAAGVVNADRAQVRVITYFEIRAQTLAPNATGALTATFTTATILPSGGRLTLELPANFSFGVYLGENCTSDSAQSQGAFALAVVPMDLPSDATLACIRLPSNGAPAYEWTMGPSGLRAATYSVSVVVQNPEVGPAGTFTLRTFLDSTRTQIADGAAVTSAALRTYEMPQAEIISGYINDSSPLWNWRPKQLTWVAFAFELRRNISSNFTMVLRAPAGYQVPGVCRAHVGDGKAYTPLGTIAQPALATQYVLFPPRTNVSCLGRLREARISVMPADPGNVTNFTAFPASPWKMYIFRVRVRNPTATPAINEWLLQVADQEYSAIPGYNLWEFRKTSVSPSGTAAGDVVTVTIQFWSRTAVRGLSTQTGRHGLILLKMPAGFQLQSYQGMCLGFAGLQNLSGSVGSALTCEAWPADPRTIILRNKLTQELPPTRYTFTCKIMNPVLPVDASEWTMSSYSRQTADDATLLDVGTIPGYAVNAKMPSFGVQPLPSGQQNAGDLVSLRFALMLSSELRMGDALIVRSPAEYVLICSGVNFQSQYLPRPTCAGSVAVFSFANVSASLLPDVVAAAAEGATVVAFVVGALNPPAKPARNELEFAHCRDVDPTANLFQLALPACPTGSRTVASILQPLWPIVPQLTEVAVGLLSRKVAAQNRSSNVQLSFRTASSGARKLLLECTGMDFGQCKAQVQAVAVTCTGSMNRATLTLPSSLKLAARQLVQVSLRAVVNPAEPGTTTWSITTYGPSETGTQVVYDKASTVAGPTILRYLALSPVSECTPQYLLRSDVDSTWQDNCTARFPWYEQVGNPVVLRFGGLAGGEVLQGHQLVVQPPMGYTFPSSPDVMPLQGSGFRPGAMPGTLAPVGASVAQITDLSLETLPSLSHQVLLINLTSGLTMFDPFALRLTVNNPGVDPKANLWRVMLLGPDMVPLYTNDGNWQGFSLRGTFLAGGRTTVASLVSSFPSESNVVRLTFALASALAGVELRLRFVAPAGFSFAAVCLPEDPDFLPQLNATVGAWTSGCSADPTRRNVATLTIPNVGTGGGLLQKGITYAANLLITNAQTFTEDSIPVWELYTFWNMDLTKFVHYIALPSFPLQVLWARVVPEVPMYEASSLLHVSLRPLRDLGPNGQLVLTAPTEFRLYCRLRPYFDKGNLPSGVSCVGANNIAVVQLSGSDFLAQGLAYHFAVRVTNPTAAEFAAQELTNPGETWSLRLQTQDRVLVHETSQVPPYAMAAQAIERFGVASDSVVANDMTWLSVQFKLDSPLARATTNRLELGAPSGVRFRCAAIQARDSFVLPATAIQPAGLLRFDELEPRLEPPAARDSEVFRNDGTTEDGRAIVDCGQQGVLALAVDSTDTAALGRYAFRVQVVNPPQTPDLNVWTLRAYSDGQLTQEGAANGYDIVPAMSSGAVR